MDAFQATVRARCRILVQVLLLCEVAQARAKSPSETMYCEPLSNTTSIMVMVFLLSEQARASKRDALYYASSDQTQHGTCHANSFQLLGLNPLKYWLCLHPLASLNKESPQVAATNRGSWLLEVWRDRVGGMFSSAKESIASFRTVPEAAFSLRIVTELLPL